MSNTQNNHRASKSDPPEANGGSNSTQTLYSVWEDPHSQPPTNTLEVLHHVATRNELQQQKEKVSRDSGSESSREQDEDVEIQTTLTPPASQETPAECVEQNQTTVPPEFREPEGGVVETRHVTEEVQDRDQNNHLVRVTFEEHLRVDALIEDNDFILTTTVPRVQPAEVIAALQAADLVEPGAWRRQGLHWQYENAHRHYIRVPNDLRRPLLQAAGAHMEIQGRKLERRSNASIPFKLTVSTAKKTETKITLEHVPVTLKHHHLKYILSNANLTNVSGLRQETGNPSRWTCWVGVPEENITHTIRLENPVKGDRRSTPDITVRVQGRKIRCKHCGLDSHFSSRCPAKEVPERFSRPRNEEERLAAARDLLALNAQADNAPTSPRGQASRQEHHLQPQRATVLPYPLPEQIARNQINAQPTSMKSNYSTVLQSGKPGTANEQPLTTARVQLHEIAQEMQLWRNEKDQRFYDEIIANAEATEAEQQKLAQLRLDEQTAREKRVKDNDGGKKNNKKTLERVTSGEDNNNLVLMNRYDFLRQIDDEGNPLQSVTEEEDEDEEKHEDEEEYETDTSEKQKAGSKNSQKEKKKQKKIERRQKRKNETEESSQEKKEENKKKKKAKDKQMSNEPQTSEIDTDQKEDKDREGQNTATKEALSALPQDAPQVAHNAQPPTSVQSAAEDPPTFQTQTLNVTFEQAETGGYEEDSPKELTIDLSLAEDDLQLEAPRDPNTLFNVESQHIIQKMISGVPPSHLSETTNRFVKGMLEEPESDTQENSLHVGNEFIDDSINSQHLGGDGTETTSFFTPMLSLVSTGSGGTGETVSGVSAQPGLPQTTSTPLTKRSSGQWNSTSSTGTLTRSRTRNFDALDMTPELAGNMSNAPRHVKTTKKSLSSRLSSAVISLTSKISPPNKSETPETAKAAQPRRGSIPKALGSNPRERKSNSPMPAPQSRK